MQKEYRLGNPLEVMNDTKGEFEKQDLLVIKVGGFSDVKALKGYQDKVFKIFMKSVKSNKDTEDKTDTSKDDKLDAETMLAVLEMEGTSEEMFDMSFDLIKRCGTIGTKKISAELIEQMTIEDMDMLYEKVMKDFLSKKAISRLNSMSK